MRREIPRRGGRGGANQDAKNLMEYAIHLADLQSNGAPVTVSEVSQQYQILKLTPDHSVQVAKEWIAQANQNGERIPAERINDLIGQAEREYPKGNYGPMIQ